MKGVLVAIHAVSAGVWLGCILTETVFERQLLSRGRDAHGLLGRLHVRVDTLVEIPAMVLVLVSGLGLLLTGVSASAPLMIMISLGALGLLTNVYCVWLVFGRADAADDKRWSEFDRLDRQQHRFGAIVLLAVIGAFFAALALRVGA